MSEMENYCIKNEPRETVKMILESMDSVLSALESDINRLNTNLVGTYSVVADEPEKNVDMCMFDTLVRQRCVAERILKTVADMTERLY